MIRLAARRLLVAVLATVAAAGAQAAALTLTATPAAVSVGTPSDPAVPTATDARVVGDESRTKFIVDLTGAVAPTVFLLSDPYRLVIDLAEVRFALPATVGRTGRGLVLAFRYGQFSAGKSRVVMDLKAPVRIDQTYVTEAGQGQPARLVVELVPATREDFLAAVTAHRNEEGAAAAARDDRLDIAPRSAKRVVVIDPGHGGIDLGALGRSGTQEKTVALAFAKVLADKLTATGRYEVYLTRTDDSFVSLADRVAFAQAQDADLLLSVHANSYSSTAARGAAVYTFCEQVCDADASRMALSENQSDALAGIDVAAGDANQVRDILTDLTRRETLNFAQVFALNLVQELKISNTALLKDPHREANFQVLTAADVPSALIELGFITNLTDEKLLASPDWQASTADAMVRAVGDFFAAQLPPGVGKTEVLAQSPR